MTPEAQRIAIAEACGWRDIINHGGALLGIAPNETRTFQTAAALSPSEIRYKKSILPDYLNDLNTRGEMLERIVDSKLTDAFETCFRVKWHALTCPQPEFCGHFLRTIGKWVD